MRTYPLAWKCGAAKSLEMNDRKRTTTCSILWLTTSLSHGPYCSFRHHQSRPALADALSMNSHISAKRRRHSLGQPTVTRFYSTALGSSATSTASPPLNCLDPDFFLHQVETTVHNVLSQFPDHGNNNESNLQEAQKDFLLTLGGSQRESFGVAQNLHQRLSGLRKNNDCPRCWMQRAHCICKNCPPLGDNVLPQLNRIFLILHHKEVAMKVDTAKLIMAAFPYKCRLVVAGIAPEYQASMKELNEAMEISSSSKKCLVLFPDETAKSMHEILVQDYGQLLHYSNHNDNDDSEEATSPSSGSRKNNNSNNNKNIYQPYDLIVLDGTWAQARKIHTKYILPAKQGGPRRVQLSESAVETLQEANDQSGHQLRRHTIAWRQVGTYEATRLFLKDLDDALPNDNQWLSSSIPATTCSESLSTSEAVWKQIAKYQSIANEAARRELGPPRESQKKLSWWILVDANHFTSAKNRSCLKFQLLILICNTGSSITTSTRALSHQLGAVSLLFV